jgi:hypothetical protein
MLKKKAVDRFGIIHSGFKGKVTDLVTAELGSAVSGNSGLSYFCSEYNSDY